MGGTFLTLPTDDLTEEYILHWAPAFDRKGNANRGSAVHRKNYTECTKQDLTPNFFLEPALLPRNIFFMGLKPSIDVENASQPIAVQ